MTTAATLRTIDTLIERKKSEMDALDGELAALRKTRQLLEPAQLALPPPAKKETGAPKGKPGQKTAASAGSVEVDIDGKKFAVTPEQKKFVDAMDGAEDCFPRDQAQALWGSYQKFLDGLKSLRAQIAPHGFEINAYHGKGYRLEQEPVSH